MTRCTVTAAEVADLLAWAVVITRDWTLAPHAGRLGVRTPDVRDWHPETLRVVGRHNRLWERRLREWDPAGLDRLMRAIAEEAG